MADAYFERPAGLSDAAITNIVASGEILDPLKNWVPESSFSQLCTIAKVPEFRRQQFSAALNNVLRVIYIDRWMRLHPRARQMVEYEQVRLAKQMQQVKGAADHLIANLCALQGDALTKFGETLAHSDRPTLAEVLQTPGLSLDDRAAIKFLNVLSQVKKASDASSIFAEPVVPSKTLRKRENPLVLFTELMVVLVSLSGGKLLAFSKDDASGSLMKTMRVLVGSLPAQPFHDFLTDPWAERGNVNKVNEAVLRARSEICAEVQKRGQKQD